MAIRPWLLSDAKALAAALNDGEVQSNLRDGLPYPYTADDAREFISAMLAAGDSAYAFAITHGGECVGGISVTRGENIHRFTGELGYYVARTHWGLGLATLAVREICGYIFANTDIMRIYAEPFDSNAASCRVLEKAGFALEGTLRANAVKLGEARDMRMYALVRPDILEKGSR